MFSLILLWHFEIRSEKISDKDQENFQTLWNIENNIEDTSSNLITIIKEAAKTVNKTNQNKKIPKGSNQSQQ